MEGLDGSQNGRMATVEQIWAVVEPYLAAEQLELDDLELIGHGRTRTVRVTLDAAPDPNGPAATAIDLDRISEVSRGLSRLLDHATDLEGPYQLEVTSPGLERRLARPAHFEKSIGREVVVKTATGTIRGQLATAGDSSFEVTTPDGPRQVTYADVISARTVFRWEKAPRPGQKGAGA
jgi:ribosome maturation factor RimP